MKGRTSHAQPERHLVKCCESNWLGCAGRLKKVKAPQPRGPFSKIGRSWAATIVLRSRLAESWRKAGWFARNQTMNEVPAGNWCSGSANRSSAYAANHGA